MNKQDIFVKGTKGQHLQITPFHFFSFLWEIWNMIDWRFPHTRFVNEVQWKLRNLSVKCSNYAHSFSIQQQHLLKLAANSSQILMDVKSQVKSPLFI